MYTRLKFSDENVPVNLTLSSCLNVLPDLTHREVLHEETRDQGKLLGKSPYSPVFGGSKVDSLDPLCSSRSAASALNATHICRFTTLVLREAIRGSRGSFLRISARIRMMFENERNSGSTSWLAAAATAWVLLLLVVLVLVLVLLPDGVVSEKER
ncbi:hypothetical protein V1478_012988 [Vespula squamosa]|uniref:Uncharacterized protein n=1 Tax=Vespula squamosa TaxID=30214 RepID=A0ABD2A9I6_VESSQ